MKIILPVSGCNKSLLPTLESYGGVPLQVIPDTSLLGAKQPFFIPDYAPQCRAHLHVAVSVSRLGRCIDSRFAHRYYDAVTAVVRFTAHPLYEELHKQGLPCDVACSFDGSVAVGTFVPVNASDKAQPKPLSLSLAVNGNEAMSIQTDDVRSAADDLVASASLFHMLRQGDLLLSSEAASTFDVKIDDHLEVSVDGHVVRAFNVK